MDVYPGAAAHEAFSIMLQERMDEELPSIHQALDDVKATISALGERMSRAEENAKAQVLHALIKSYRQCHTNMTDRPDHYLLTLAEDMLECLPEERLGAPEGSQYRRSRDAMRALLGGRFADFPRLASAFEQVSDMCARAELQDLIALDESMEIPDLGGVDEESDL